MREDAQGVFRYVEANAATADLLELRPDQLQGKRPAELLGPEVGERIESLYRDVVERDETREITHENTIGGEPRVTQTRLQPLEFSDGTRGVLVVALDLTERFRARRELESDREALRELYELAGRSDLELMEKLERLLEIGCHRLGLPYGFVTEIEDGVQTIIASFGNHSGLEVGETAPLQESYCRQTIASSDGFRAIPDATDEGLGDDPAYRRSNLGCYIGASLEFGGALRGTICFAQTAPRRDEFQNADRIFVKLLGKWSNREYERRELARERKHRARTDALTGLVNHGELLRRAHREVDRVSRHGGALALLMLDLDRFKRVNDELGHGAGDDVLRSIGELLEGETRSSDVAARYGGEEFAVLAPEAGKEEIRRLAGRIGESVRERSIPTVAGDVGITCSIGLSVLGDPEKGVDSLFRRADRALYEAKHRGRDCIVTAWESSRRPAE